MKTSFTVITSAVVILLGVFFFSKPSDAFIKEQITDQVSHIAYIQRLRNINGQGFDENFTTAEAKKNVTIEDKLVYKTISYYGYGRSYQLGRAYLGKFVINDDWNSN